jgi:hypothetical protein
MLILELIAEQPGRTTTLVMIAFPVPLPGTLYNAREVQTGSPSKSPLTCLSKTMIMLSGARTAAATRTHPML